MSQKNNPAPRRRADKIQADIELAKEICDQIKAGNNIPIEKVYFKYHEYFYRFALKQLSDWGIQGVSGADELMTDFWLNILNGKVICEYAHSKHQLKNKASLKNYLFLIVRRRISDKKRQIDRQNKKDQSMRDDTIHFRQQEVVSRRDSDYAEGIYETADEEVRYQLLSKAINLLAEADPKSWQRIRMQLSGKTYREMAEIELAGDNPDPEALRKREQSIRKAFTREQTGCLAKLRTLMERLTEQA